MNALTNHVWGRSAAQDRVWAQVACMGPTRAVRRLIMSLNFQAFMDESESSYEFVLGGYIQTAEVWAQLARDWEEILPRHGLRADDGRYYFKMSHMARHGKMDDAAKFYSLIEKHNLIPISFRMNMHDFERAKESMREFAFDMKWFVQYGNWESPWYFCFRCLLDEFHIRKHVFEEAIPLAEKIDFYFDSRDDAKPIMAAWSDIKDNMPEEAEKYFGHDPRFERDEDFLGLQAADFWAWWVRRWYEEDAATWPDRPVKMTEQLDFGTWRGKNIKKIQFDIGEQAILYRLKHMAIESILKGQVDPISLSHMKLDLG